MPDYPGFGKSSGTIDEMKLYRQADQVFQMAAVRFPKDSIILYGRSLGTGIAAYVASTGRGRKLILESPYYDMPSLLNRYFFLYPLRQILRFYIPTWKFLRDTDRPVVIIHGEADGVIPIGHAHKLQKFLKPTDIKMK
jgi:pimeloyl-ACP methyl ester carboxylesterase